MISKCNSKQVQIQHKNVIHIAKIQTLYIVKHILYYFFCQMCFNWSLKVNIIFSPSLEDHKRLRKYVLTFPFQFISWCCHMYLAISTLFYSHFCTTMLFSFKKVKLYSDLARYFTTFNILHFSLCLRPVVWDYALSSWDCATVIKIMLKASLGPGWHHEDKF